MKNSKKDYISPEMERLEVKLIRDCLVLSSPGYVDNPFPWEDYLDGLNEDSSDYDPIEPPASPGDGGDYLNWDDDYGPDNGSIDIGDFDDLFD